jgi:hypothetical protein
MATEAMPPTRSDGPTLNSPVREGGVDAVVIFLSAEGAPQFVPALRASEKSTAEFPPLRTGY